MIRFLKEKLQMIVLFMLFYLAVEIVTFAWVKFDFLPKDLMIDLVIVFAVSSLVFLIRSIKISILYLSFIFLLVIVLFFVNATMYSVYYDLFTLQQLQLIGEATEVINAELLNWQVILITVGFIATYTTAMVFLAKHLKKRHETISNYYAKSLATFFVSALFVFGFFMLNTTSIDGFLSDSHVTTFKRASFEKYGIFGYYTKEIEDFIEGDGYGHYNGLPQVMSEPTDYFGLLEGKNVITILLESIQPFAVNEVLTPNLYMLSQEGLYFENSYSENKTNVSELIGMIGNYPSISLFPDNNTYDFSYGLPSILANNGYKTTYLHDNLPSFYVRGALMPEIGFQNLVFHDQLYPDQENWTWDGHNWNGDYTPDSITMDRLLPYFSSTDQPFYTYWATLVTHGPYNYGPVNKQLFTEFGYFDAIDQAEADGLWTNPLAGGDETDVLRLRHYQAAVMDLDVAIGKLLDDLRSKNLLDDTVLVLFGDHNVYYHNIYLKMFNETENDYFNMDMYHNYFCIYNPELSQAYLDQSGAPNTTISKFVTPYNIVPTLMDLLGIQYNQNLFMGSSVFASTDDVFYSIKLTGFFNGYMYSDDGINIIYSKRPYTEEELADFVAKCEVLKYKIGYINKYYLDSKTPK